MVEAVLPKTMILPFAFFHRPVGPCLAVVVAAEEANQTQTSYRELRVQVEAASTRKKRRPVAAAVVEEAVECQSWQPRPNSPSQTICTEGWAGENRSRCSDRHCLKPMPAAEVAEVATLFPSSGYLEFPSPSLVDGYCWSPCFLLSALNDYSTTYLENDFACIHTKYKFSQSVINLNINQEPILPLASERQHSKGRCQSVNTK